MKNALLSWSVKCSVILCIMISFVACLSIFYSSPAYALDENEYIEYTSLSNIIMNSSSFRSYVKEELQSSNNSSNEENSATLSDEEDGITTKQGKVSQLNADSHNPYHGMLRVSVFVGSEFASFGGTNAKAHDKISEVSEGYIFDVAPGGSVELPRVRAKSGYYLVGWCTGGIPDYNDTDSGKFWRAGTTEITLEQSDSSTKNVTIYAVYANDEGDAYCTCGAWESKAYANNIDEIKATYNDYKSTDAILGVLFGVLVLLGVTIIVILEKKK